MPIPLHRTKTLEVTFFLVYILLSFGYPSFVSSSRAVSFQPHAPIQIRGNGAFTPSNGVIGGSGAVSDPYVIEGWQIDSGSGVGISIAETNNYFVVRNVNITSLQGDGIILSNVVNGLVQDVAVFGATTGIRCSPCVQVTVEKNHFSRVGWGVFVGGVSSRVTLTENSINGTGQQGALAIYVEGGIDIGIIGNAISGAAMRIQGCGDVDIIGNSMSSLPPSTEGITGSGCRGTKIEGNQIRSAGFNGMEWAYPVGLTISGNYISSAVDFGILLEFTDISSDVVITDNVVTSNRRGGIGLKDPYHGNLTISNNTISENGGNGVSLDFQVNDKLSITKNRVISNMGHGIFIHRAGADSVVKSNLVASNRGDGIRAGLYLSNVTANQVNENAGTGIRVDGRAWVLGNNITRNGSYGFQGTSVVYHNNFIANTVQGAGEGPWDSGYPGGGNYWSDYRGEDHCSGPKQDVCNVVDGIGDTPYFINPQSSDHYPLMVPYIYKEPVNNSAPTPEAPQASPLSLVWAFLQRYWLLVAILAGVVVAVPLLMVRRKKNSVLSFKAQN